MPHCSILPSDSLYILHAVGSRTLYACTDGSHGIDDGEHLRRSNPLVLPALAHDYPGSPGEIVDPDQILLPIMLAREEDAGVGGEWMVARMGLPQCGSKTPSRGLRLCLKRRC